MKFGFVMPKGDARTSAEFAKLAEDTGWDGFFVWEPVWGVDAWVSLTAAAMVTERIRLGTMLTPLSRMRPWKLASETATLDRLSNGRVILSVGLGSINSGFSEFGEITDRKTRVELLDEGLDILVGLWKGQPFNYQGKHYQIRETSFFIPPPPIQQPRIPIWVVGAWPKEKSLQRALRYDGLLPAFFDEDKKEVRFEPATPPEIEMIHRWVLRNRIESTPFEIVVEGTTPADDRGKAIGIVQPFAASGATWWIEALWGADSLEEISQRLRQGPPREI